MNTNEFFVELFDDKPFDNLICIFTLPDRVPDFFKNIDNAAIHTDTVAAPRDQNIYFCTNFLYRRPKTGRGTSEDSGGVSCFYMDVDIDTMSNAHAKSSYPRSEAEAVALVKGNNFDPSIIVNSGYGLHVYWLFKEPWLFVDNNNRNEAKEKVEREKYHDLLLRLQATIKAKAAKSGWSLDSTGDLARILRVPGSFNIKVPDNPLEVKVIEHALDSNGLTLRYNPYDIEPYLVDETIVKRTKLSDDMKAQVYGDIVLRGNANPPQDKLEQLCEIEEKFAQAWKAKRPEFGNDPSAYAQSLANYAARANWTRQEMCDLLIAFYRKHLENPLFKNRPGKEPISLARIMRISKIGTTIGKAIVAAQEAAAKQYDQDIDPAAAAGLDKLVDPDGSGALQYIQSHLRLDVAAIYCYVPEADKGGFYEMQIRKGAEIKSVVFDSVEKMFNQPLFKLRVIDGARISPSHVDKETWGKAINAFLRVMQDIKVSPSTETIEGKMKAWCEQYIEHKPALTWIQACRTGQPFVDEGCWHFFAKPFGDWCWQNKGMIEGITRAQINLKRIGAEELRFNRILPDSPRERVAFRAWKIPNTIVIPPPTVVVKNTWMEEEKNDEPIENFGPTS